MKTWVALIAIAALAGCGGDSTFTASGTLGLVAVDAATDDCGSGTGGFDDISEGADVVIYDAAGKRLAFGSLKAGKPQGDGGLCVFDFEIPEVPRGKGPYGIEVGSRGQVSFSEDKAEDIAISLG